MQTRVEWKIGLGWDYLNNTIDGVGIIYVISSICSQEPQQSADYKALPQGVWYTLLYSAGGNSGGCSGFWNSGHSGDILWGCGIQDGVC